MIGHVETLPAPLRFGGSALASLGAEGFRGSRSQQFLECPDSCQNHVEPPLPYRTPAAAHPRRSATTSRPTTFPRPPPRRLPPPIVLPLRNYRDAPPRAAHPQRYAPHAALVDVGGFEGEGGFEWREREHDAELEMEHRRRMGRSLTDLPQKEACGGGDPDRIPLARSGTLPRQRRLAPAAAQVAGGGEEFLRAAESEGRERARRLPARPSASSPNLRSTAGGARAPPAAAALTDPPRFSPATTTSSCPPRRRGRPRTNYLQSYRHEAAAPRTPTRLRKGAEGGTNSRLNDSRLNDPATMTSPRPRTTTLRHDPSTNDPRQVISQAQRPSEWRPPEPQRPPPSHDPGLTPRRLPNALMTPSFLASPRSRFSLRRITVPLTVTSLVAPGKASVCVSVCGCVFVCAAVEGQRLGENYNKL
ncbi:hypothetical protein C7M84_017751 [Penaeus vannamei]|uniref:Uncharacterized protein n=1 Tax=Penaeus vannamei TaxID=6689 RepID=A0A423SJG2_PENVA|nr:hypothetical protein C7M84_017751 [Penaeus vannamei]